MPEPESELRFDRASYVDASGTGSPCANCKGPLGESYWKWHTHIVCTACRDRMIDVLAKSQSAGRLGKAFLVGGATALGCGIVYAVFVGVTKIQFALATIAIGFIVAKVVRKVSGGIGGTRFQVLAVTLTYLASAMGYAPAVLRGIKQSAAESAKGSSSNTEAPKDSSAQEPAVDADPGGPKTKARGSALGLVVAFGFLFAITLAAPVLEITRAPIGFFIVLVGLWEAWRLSRGPPLTFEGPFRAKAAQTSPSA